MADVETKQIKREEPLPLLSLKSVQDEKAKKTENPEAEQLWKRSLEFFEQMKAASNS